MNKKNISLLGSALIFCTLTQAQQATQYDTDLLSKEFHKLRREALRQQMPANSVALFFTTPVRNRSNDVDFLYHQNPDFYYLSGYTEPNGVMLIFKEEQKIDSINCNALLFVEPRNPKAEMWTGRRLGKDGAKKTLGIEALDNTQFEELNLDFKRFSKVYYAEISEGIADDKYDKYDLYELLKLANEKTTYPAGNTDNAELSKIMAALRQAKQPEELELMRKAINASCKGITALMKTLSPGMKEYQAQAVVECVFKMNGSEYPGYPSIVGGGENSCILHYESNRKLLVDGDMLVADVGAEYHGYSADVTRTLPVNGKFSPEQKLIYELVLKAQLAGIEACKVDNGFKDPDKAAREVVNAGLKELGIANDTKQAYKYFPHGTSHYLGLDVHDAGTYGKLAAGDVITVEPGIYIPAGSDCDPKWWNIGVRIEDDILITEKGYENLSACVPKTVEEIESLMKQTSEFNTILGK